MNIQFLKILSECMSIGGDGAPYIVFVYIFTVGCQYDLMMTRCMRRGAIVYALLRVFEFSCRLRVCVCACVRVCLLASMHACMGAMSVYCVCCVKCMSS